MKLYFPTTSLNFNDIFATESISPKYFYQNRQFGTRRHFATELALSGYGITLFEKIPYFKLVDSHESEYEEYPIIFELNIDPEQYKLTQIDNGIYVTFRTLYIDYSNIKVLFFSETDYKTVLTKSKLVSETKTVSKYQHNFKIIKNPIFSTMPNFSSHLFDTKAKEDIYNELEIDRIFNNIKGFYYAYISPKISLDYNKRSSNLNLTSEAFTKFEELYNLYTQISTTNNGIVLDLINMSLKYVKKDTELSKKTCNDFFDGIDIFQLDNRNHVEFNKTKIKLTDELVIFLIILNAIMDKPKTKLSDVTKEDIENLLNIIENKILETFDIKSTYINDYNLIYQRIIERNYSIDISLLNSSVLQNFFAFILKYNNIDELFKFLELKNIRNKNLAFSFLGAFVGFSGLSRIITINTFSEKNKDLLIYIDNKLNNFRQHIRMNICTKSKDNLLQLNFVNNTHQLQSQHLDENRKVSPDINKNELKKQIYLNIQQIKNSKKLNVFMKKSIINLTTDIQVNFEKNDDNVDVIFWDSKYDIIINILLKNKNNLQKNEVVTFKNELHKLGLEKYSIKCNYPVFIYNKTVGDENQLLNIDEEIRLLEYLISLNKLS